MTSKGTPPRHRILNHLDNYKQQMPDNVYKALADSIASECSPTSAMHKITYVEMCDAIVWQEDEAPTEGNSEAVMKEVEMPLVSFLFSFCSCPPEFAATAAKCFANKEWNLPKTFHKGMMHGEDMGCMQLSVKQTIIILSISEI